MPASTVLTTALRLLSRREHTRGELEQKLAHRGYAESDIAAALDRLADNALQSDKRFCRAYIRQYGQRFGDFRLAAELKKRRVAAADIDTELAAAALPPENERAVEVLQKKYPGLAAASRAAAQRFLQQRGFSSESIRAALSAFKRL